MSRHYLVTILHKIVKLQRLNLGILTAAGIVLAAHFVQSTFYTPVNELIIAFIVIMLCSLLCRRRIVRLKAQAAELEQSLDSPGTDLIA